MKTNIGRWYKGMWYKGIVLLGLCLLVIGIPFTDRVAAEHGVIEEDSKFSRTFLLEQSAVYDVSVSLRTEMSGEATTITVFIQDEKGEHLSFAQMYRGLEGNGEWQEISLQVVTPPRAQRAEIVLSSPRQGEVWWRDLEIKRVQEDKISAKSEWLAKLAEVGQVYTGLVIDARGLDLERGMSPRIWSESGELIYGGVAAPLDFVQEIGVASYAEALSQDLFWRLQFNEEESYINPLEVKAIAVADKTRTGVVISDEDAGKIQEAMQVHDFLARFSVVFLVD